MHVADYFFESVRSVNALGVASFHILYLSLQPVDEVTKSFESCHNFCFFLKPFLVVMLGENWLPNIKTIDSFLEMVRRCNIMIFLHRSISHLIGRTVVMKRLNWISWLLFFYNSRWIVCCP